MNEPEVLSVSPRCCVGLLLLLCRPIFAESIALQGSVSLSLCLSLSLFSCFILLRTQYTHSVYELLFPSPSPCRYAILFGRYTHPPSLCSHSNGDTDRPANWTAAPAGTPPLWASSRSTPRRYIYIYTRLRRAARVENRIYMG